MKKILISLFSFVGLHLTVYSQWVKIDSTETNNLISVFFPTKDTGYVVGDFQLILKTTDAGNTWVTQSNPFSGHLSSVYFTNANTGFAVGENIILKTINGGNKWDTAFNAAGFDNCMSVFFPSKNIGYVLAANSNYLNNSNYKTIDGGNTWVAQHYTWANGGTIGSIFFTDTVTGYAAVSNAILKTTDGGDIWIKKDSSTSEYNSVFFPTKDTGFVVTGGGHILKTIDAGNTWITYLTGLVSPNGLYSVCFTSSNIGYAGGGEPINGGNGMVFKTTDSGLSWIPQTMPSLGSPMLNSIFFTGKDTGYAVGDATILKTTSGGVTSINVLKGLNNKLEICPNPANNLIQISFIGIDKIQPINLYDILGKQVKNEEIKSINNTIQLDVSDLNEGIYFLRINKANENLERKIIIQR